MLAAKFPVSMACEMKRTEPSHIAPLTPPVWKLLADIWLFDSALSLAQLGEFGGLIVMNVV